MNGRKKTSRECVRCRRRKASCDQTKSPTSSCLQCQRARLPHRTTRYVRESSQETTMTRSSISDARSNSFSLYDTESTPTSTTLSELPKSTDGLQISRPLTGNITDESICIFLHKYVLDDSTDGGVHLTYSQMVEHANSSQAVRYAMSAIGLAILSNTRNNITAAIQARADYSKALQLTSVGLKTQAKSSIQDITLNAVILLSMFEVMICGTPKSLENWETHISGAASFVRLWDCRQICSSVGMQLFTQLRTDLIANCLRTQTHVPDMVRRLSDLVQSCRSEADCRVEDLVGLICDVSDLLADVKGKRMLEDPMEDIERARELDGRLQAWSLILPTRWQFMLVRTSNDRPRNLISELSFNDYYHVYSDLWACNIWNYYRNARILVNLLIRGRILAHLTIKPHPKWKSLLDEANTNIGRVSVDILLSVPFSIAVQFFSWHQGANSPRPGGCLGGFYILWPLYVAASVQPPKTPLRDWAAMSLEYIGRKMGIGQALLMARIVRGELPQDALSVYDYCHSYLARSQGLA